MIRKTAQKMMIWSHQNLRQCRLTLPPERRPAADDSICSLRPSNFSAEPSFVKASDMVNESGSRKQWEKTGTLGYCSDATEKRRRRIH
jgi:hypothetical protein